MAHHRRAPARHPEGPRRGAHRAGMPFCCVHELSATHHALLLHRSDRLQAHHVHITSGLPTAAQMNSVYRTCLATPVARHFGQSVA